MGTLRPHWPSPRGCPMPRGGGTALFFFFFCTVAGLDKEWGRVAAHKKCKIRSFSRCISCNASFIYVLNKFFLSSKSAAVWRQLLVNGLRCIVSVARLLFGDRFGFTIANEWINFKPKHFLTQKFSYLAKIFVFIHNFTKKFSIFIQPFFLSSTFLQP